MQIDKPSMSMYASLEDYRKALAEWQWQLGVVAFHGIDTEAETDGVFVVIGTTDPEVFAQEIQKAKLLRESKDDEGYEHDTPLQAWAALQDGVWNFDASEDTPGACPALVANLRWELPDDDQGHPCGHQCSGCNVPKNGLYQIAEPSHSMSQYASKDDMLRAVMAENERLKAQLAAAQQGVQQSIEQDVREIVGLLKNREWAEHIGQTELGRELEHEITKLYNATHPTTQGLEQFIEQAGDVHFQRCRLGSIKGPIRWDVSFGHHGIEVRGKTLQEAIAKALAAQAKQGGA